MVTLLLWAQMRQYALSTRASNIKAMLSEMPPSTENFLEIATCVAIDYFLQILWLKNHTQRTVHAPFHHANGAVQILRDVAELDTSPLTLWILFIAATVELILTQRGQKDNTFSKALARPLQEFQLTTVDNTRHLLSQFLYQKEAFDQYLGILVNATKTLTAPLDNPSEKITKTFYSGYPTPARFGMHPSKTIPRYPQEISINTVSASDGDSDSQPHPSSFTSL